MTNLSHRMSLKDERIRNAHVPVPKAAPANIPWSSEAQDRLREAMIEDAKIMKSRNLALLRIKQREDCTKGLGQSAKKCLAALDVLGNGVTVADISSHIELGLDVVNNALYRMRARGIVKSRLIVLHGQRKNLWYRTSSEGGAQGGEA
jgi:hypothetical protein